jgi:hypothetical protein
MKSRRTFALIAASAGVLVLAFLLRAAVYEGVILPLAQLFWWLRVLYRAVPQVVYWVILIVVLVYLVISTFALHLPEIQRSGNSGGLRVGKVQQVSFWLTRSRRGIFSRWQVANLLANIALDILSSRSSSGRRGLRLAGAGWDPPPQVQGYLETALKTTYADYPRPGVFSGEPHTPLDSDPEPIVDYLESLMEDGHDHQHS